MPEINKKTLGHLAALARIDLKENEEQKLQKDLGAILDYFKELQELDTADIEPMTGGTRLKNVLREDVAGKTDDTGKGAEAFPEKRDSHLKVPPIF